MSKPKTPTPQGISALLRKAGFERSVSSSSRIKGWRNHSPGFVVRASVPGEVRVYHQSGWLRPSDAERQRSAESESRYADAIEAAGYAVERGSGGYFRPVIVRARTEGGDGNG